jgi:hypothetical protein
MVRHSPPGFSGRNRPPESTRKRKRLCLYVDFKTARIRAWSSIPTRSSAVSRLEHARLHCPGFRPAKSSLNWATASLGSGPRRSRPLAAAGVRGRAPARVCFHVLVIEGFRGACASREDRRAILLREPTHGQRKRTGRIICSAGCGSRNSRFREEGPCAVCCSSSQGFWLDWPSRL